MKTLQSRQRVFDAGALFCWNLLPDQARPIPLPKAMVYARGTFFAPETSVEVLARLASLPERATKEEALQHHLDFEYAKSRRLRVHTTMLKAGKLRVQLKKAPAAWDDCAELFGDREYLAVDLYDPSAVGSTQGNRRHSAALDNVARYYQAGEISGSAEQMDELGFARNMSEGDFGCLKSPYADAINVAHTARGTAEVTIMTAWRLLHMNRRLIRSFYNRGATADNLPPLRQERQRARSILQDPGPPKE